MTEKIQLKEKLAAVDLNAKSLWDEISDEQRKVLKSEFYILNRYISNAKTTSREHQEHFVITVNEYFNKHWNTLQKHPKLLWQLLCMCSHESRKVFYHEFIGFKKRAATNNKMRKFLNNLYPNKKEEEIDLILKLNSEKDLKRLAESHGFTEKQLDEYFKNAKLDE